MKLGLTMEVWCCEYRADAWTDPWGRPQWGYVVNGVEQIEVIGTAEGIEPYSNRREPDYYTIARDSEDRTYTSVPVIDYCGTRTWTRDDATHWAAKPYSTVGYCTPDGEPIVEVKSEQ